MSWSEAYNNILPYVFAIETPEGNGSGFFFAYNENKSLVAFATAAHVVEHAEDWKLPIKLRQHTSKKEQFITDDMRIITLDRRRDSASIVIANNGAFDLPDEPLPMIPADKFHRIGNEIAWVGYPGIASPHLCFFTGRVSGFISQGDSYLIDGVAINGVSGGPVFSELSEGKPQILGTVSAYLPNRIRGDALPGLMSAQDVTPFHDTISVLKSIDDAKRKKEEAEQEEQQKQHDAEQGQSIPEPSQGPLAES